MWMQNDNPQTRSRLVYSFVIHVLIDITNAVSFMVAPESLRTMDSTSSYGGKYRYGYNNYSWDYNSYGEYSGYGGYSDYGEFGDNV